MLSLDKFIFSDDVVVNKFFDLNVPIVVLVALAEQFVNYLTPMVFIDTFLCEEHQHFVFVYIAITIDVDRSELVVKFALLLSFALSELLVCILHCTLLFK